MRSLYFRRCLIRWTETKHLNLWHPAEHGHGFDSAVGYLNPPTRNVALSGHIARGVSGQSE